MLNIIRFTWRHSIGSGKWDVFGAARMGTDVYAGQWRSFMYKVNFGCMMFMALFLLSVLSGCGNEKKFGQKLFGDKEVIYRDRNLEGNCTLVKITGNYFTIDKSIYDGLIGAELTCYKACDSTGTRCVGLPSSVNGTTTHYVEVNNKVTFLFVQTTHPWATHIRIEWATRS